MVGVYGNVGGVIFLMVLFFVDIFMFFLVIVGCVGFLFMLV